MMPAGVGRSFLAQTSNLHNHVVKFPSTAKKAFKEELDEGFGVTHNSILHECSVHHVLVTG
jgi:carbonic anhydrase/acetyltransferase-like protein (isoleucine patch superfamily)